MDSQKENGSNFCDICNKNVKGGRSKLHMTNKEHVKLLIIKFRKLKEESQLHLL